MSFWVEIRCTEGTNVDYHTRCTSLTGGLTPAQFVNDNTKTIPRHLAAMRKEALSLGWSTSGGEWYCPVCTKHKATK